MPPKLAKRVPAKAAKPAKVTKKVKTTTKTAKVITKKVDLLKAVTASNKKTVAKALSKKSAPLANTPAPKTPRASKSAPKKAGKAASKVAVPAAASPSTPTQKTIKFTGVAPVDEYVSGSSSYKVYFDNKAIYSKKLNYSDVCGNNNKFYIIQLLESGGSYWLFTRWGRVGVCGMNAKKNCSNVTKGIADFWKKLNEKKCKGYQEIEIVYGDDEDQEDPETTIEEHANKSKLPKQVTNLVKKMFDMKIINQVMAEIGYDVKKMPLGKLSSNAIDNGYSILNSLMDEIKSKNKSIHRINDLSSQFYTQIPHDFGFQNMLNFVLKDEKSIQAKLDLLDSLKNMKITKSLTEIKHGKDSNIIEENYKKLKCDIAPLEKNSDTFKVVNDFLQTSNPSDHRCYNIELQEVFELDREGEQNRFDTKCKDIRNRRLLWHGSLMTNFVGIISQGLRIAPPEAPASGYNFGKGVYFADMIAKSACYCRAESTNKEALILLCEVACGTPNEKSHFDYNAAKLPKGKHSTLGLGRNYPDPNNEIIHDGVVVPMGPPAKKADNKDRGIGYDEWIVYDVNQIKMKYLLQCKFKSS